MISKVAITRVSFDVNDEFVIIMNNILMVNSIIGNSIKYSKLRLACRDSIITSPKTRFFKRLKVKKIKLSNDIFRDICTQ